METGEKGIELFASAPKPLPKISTHIEGLDQILEGGLPAQRTILIMGEPGTGKTVLALEILYRGACRGEPGILVSFEESPQDIRENAATFGWDLEALEDRGLLYLMEGKMDSATLIEGRFSLEPLLAIISGKAREMGAKRAVLDAPDVLLAMIDDASMARAQLQFLTEWLSASGLTTLMTIKPRQVGIGRLFQEFFDSMSDCVISLSARVMDQVTTRRLRVLKYRGSGFGKNEYPFVISGSGIKLIPITVFQLLHKPFGERISSGIERLDGLLGGGFFRNSCILLAGEPGTGKTLMASAFAEHRCEEGEKVLYVSFEESQDALVRNVSSAGIDLAGPLKRGSLRFLCAMPESKGAEEHLMELVDEVQGFAPDHVIVDSISACERMGGKQAAFEYLMRLLNYLKERGITILMVNQTSGSKAQLEISGSGISSMIDTVIFFSYVHGEGETNRAIQVLKSRGSGHSNQIRECVITDEGIRILDPYVGPGGVFTGTARKVQEAKDALETRRLAAEIELKEREIERLKAALEAEKLKLRMQIEMAEWELAKLRGEMETAERERQERLRLREREWQGPQDLDKS